MAKSRRLTVVVSANTSWNLVHFRSELIDELKMEGYRVVAISPRDQSTEELRRMVDAFYEIPMKNAGISPWSEVQSLLHYRKIYDQITAKIIINFTIKSAVYGTLSAPKDAQVINTLTGLGSGFLGSATLRWIVEALLERVFTRSAVVVFQNQDDRDWFLTRTRISRKKTRVFNGSGINLDEFEFCDTKKNRPTVFAYVGRLIRDKGIREFVDAARMLQAEDPSVIFIVAGAADVANRSSISSKEIDCWVAEGVVEYWGQLSDVRHLIDYSSCLVLPSYREGASRILQEAGACGRPAIASDVPGCNNIIRHGYNGLLCRPRDASSIIEQMRIFISLPDSTKKLMGKNARRNIEQRFSITQVVSSYMIEVKNLAASVS